MKTSHVPPWIHLYPRSVASSNASLAPGADNLVAAWRKRVEAGKNSPALLYFDGKWSVGQLDEASDALAVALTDLGVAKGSHVGIYLQNLPAYPVAMLALWKLGAVALILNPMYRGRELRHLVDDAQAVGIIHADTDGAALADTLSGSTVAWRISTAAADGQTRNDARVFAGQAHAEVGPDGDLWQLVARYRGRRPATVDLNADDVALLAYTSGTTGPPKGAMNTHGNVLSVVRNYAQWADLGPTDVVLAMAPLFHITGAVVNATVALLSGAALVMLGRFHPEVALEAFAAFGVTNTVGSITAYNAMAQVPWASKEHFASARVLFSGGAPIPPATIHAFEERFGHYIHNAYGMTETTSAVIMTPPGVRAPVDESSGTLSIGIPLPGINARVLDPEGNPVAAGMEGELELTGAAIVPGYWRNPEATAHTMPEGRLHTGDGAIMDAQGWVYLVDRIKDQINVSGYKVWPREVEDALYEHPAVLEAAVVGQADPYRGEIVAAYVSLKAGQTAEPQALADFVRGRLAAYKVPRQVRIVDELPKTPTGKIRRNALRDMESSSSR